SPLPMWVFDVDSSQFLDVNIAAIKHYGYSRAEFLSMTIKDIRPVEDIYLLKESLVRYKAQPQFSRQGIFRHKKKNGEIIQVDIQSRNIQFKGKKGMVILANDITESLNYIKAIEAQNEKLKEISWMQSHVIRAPLARIKALIPLIGDVKEDIVERDKMLDYLSLSANELDDVIGNITDMTSIVDYK
ncbi:MAG TPA: PAS domain S-box protein, partial [Mucilaginibacter sp.]